MSDLAHLVCLLFGMFVAGVVATISALALLAKLGWTLPVLGGLYRVGAHVVRWFRRGRDATYIEEHIERVGSRLDLECPGAAPYVPKIRWVGPKGVSQIRDNEVVICLSPGDGLATDLVRASLDYLRIGFVREARPYMPGRLSEAMDLAVARDIVVNDAEAQRVLMTDHIAPLTESDNEIQKWFGIFDRLIAQGLFSRILLPEIGRAGRRLYPAAAPSDKIRDEFEQMTYFVNRIARRWEYEEVPLLFAGQSVRTSVILFARSATLDEYGEAAHWWRLRRNLRMGVETVYLVAFTARGLAAARSVGDMAKRARLVSTCVEKAFHRVRADGSPEMQLVIQCTSGPNVDQVPQTADEALAEACRAVVPELLDNVVEIVAAVRAPGKLSIVALRSVAEGVDAGAVVRGAHGRGEELIAEELGGAEEVRVIAWSDKPAELIAAALRLGSHPGARMVLDNGRRYCVIQLATKDAQDSVRGRRGIALRLTGKLTGWRLSTSVLPSGAGQRPGARSG